MKLTPLGIDGVWLAESPIFNDERGSFREWFKFDAVTSEKIPKFKVVQSNTSISSKGVIRGIHFSQGTFPQSKWVTCLRGEILDVVVDLREQSPTFGKWISVPLESTTGKSLFIDSGLGHAFIALEDETIVTYSLSSTYNSKFEMGISPLDPDLKIDWPLSDWVLSEKDKNAPTLKEFFQK